MITAENGTLPVSLEACGGDIFAPADETSVKTSKPKKVHVEQPKPVEAAQFVEKANKEESAKPVKEHTPVSIPDVPYEQMTVEQLQAVILEKLAKNGPVTDQMKRDVEANIWPNSLINWAKSFR